jgi:hypothetical protein
LACRSSGNSPISSRNRLPQQLLRNSRRAHLRTGEGAPGVPEQRGFNQARRNGGAIQRKKRLALANRTCVQAVRDDVLAGAGLTFHQHRVGQFGVLHDLCAQS